MKESGSGAGKAPDMQALCSSSSPGSVVQHECGSLTVSPKRRATLSLNGILNLGLDSDDDDVGGSRFGEAVETEVVVEEEENSGDEEIGELADRDPLEESEVGDNGVRG